MVVRQTLTSGAERLMESAFCLPKDLVPDETRGQCQAVNPTPSQLGPRAGYSASLEPTWDEQMCRNRKLRLGVMMLVGSSRRLPAR